jgi:outer membrane protein TolC
MRLVLVLLLAGLVGGCTRAHYRRHADSEVYPAIKQRMTDPEWVLPRISVIPPPQSRLYDPYNPDHPPLPPDDPAAAPYMYRPNGMHGYRHWHRDGDAPWIEDPHWVETLPLSADGRLVLTPERAIELGMQNSREYQTAVEAVYTTGLTLALVRFAFYVHYFLTNDTTFEHFGSGADELNTLTTSSTVGFTKLFAAGGQLMAEYLNSFIFQFAGPDTFTAPSSFVFTFLQPLLRGGGRAFVLEPLVQAERNLLYAVRTFARFRETFVFDLLNQQTGFLFLLLQVQNIRNQEANLSSLEQSLRITEARLELGEVSRVQVDQIFQQVQQARVTLLQNQTTLENALDAYKLILGLPPTLPVTIDDALLGPFQLAAPALTDLQGELVRFFAKYRELDKAPPLASLQDGFRQLKDYQARLLKLADQVGSEIDRWKRQLAEPDREQKKEAAAREQAAKELLSSEFAELRAEIAALARTLEQSAKDLREDKRTAGWEDLQKRARQTVTLADQLFVLQTQVRVYLLTLRVVKYDQDAAVQYAVTHRMDLMNQQGAVVDAWRQITVTANALRSDLNLMFNATIATLPTTMNPFDFRSSQSFYTVGFHFAAPLDREAEQNAYRLSLINYQVARRAYMALFDNIEVEVRRDLRSLETDRLSFEIARQSLTAAARGVEEVQERLLTEPAAGTTATLDTLNALNNLLTAKSTLITSWVSYESDRLQLLLDMDALQLDMPEVNTDEHDHPPCRPLATRGPLCAPGPTPDVPVSQGASQTSP